MGENLLSSTIDGFYTLKYGNNFFGNNNGLQGLFGFTNFSNMTGSTDASSQLGGDQLNGSSQLLTRELGTGLLGENGFITKNKDMIGSVATGFNNLMYAGANYMDSKISNSSGYNTMNTVLNSNKYTRGLGLAFTGFNIATSGKTDDFKVNQEVASNMGGGYRGSYSDIYDAEAHAGVNSGLLKRKKWNKRIGNAKNTESDIAEINDNNLDMLANVNNLNYIKYNSEMNGGIGSIYVGKSGMKIRRAKMIAAGIKAPITFLKLFVPIITPVPEEIPEIEETIEFKTGGTITFTPIIQLCKDGGRLSDLKNIIPEGALHVNLHHMDNAENITKKGIPVIDNNGNQQCEIERNEIIFNLEVTKKLEELCEDGSDKAAIEAGRLLVDEILHNTLDKTGLLKTIDDGSR